MARAIVGANWGDEGKGKITDMLAQESDIVSVSRAEATLDIQLSTIMEDLQCTFFHPACSHSTL